MTEKEILQAYNKKHGTFLPAMDTLRHRRYLTDALPTFMNCCEGGSCGCTGEDIQKPDAFEVAALAALDALHEVAHASYHSSQKRAVLEAIRAKIDEYRVVGEWRSKKYETNEGDTRRVLRDPSGR